MSERWMHKPRTVNVWEVRSELRYGSRHEGHFKTEEAAWAFAEEQIAAKGGVGRIGHIERNTLGGVLYYSKYEEVE